LPSFYAENPLYGVLVEPQQPSHGSIAEGRLFLDHGFDWFCEARINLSYAQKLVTAIIRRRFEVA
jgi:hypothetical protein